MCVFFGVHGCLEDESQPCRHHSGAMHPVFKFCVSYMCLHVYDDDDDDDDGGGGIYVHSTCGNQRAVLGIGPHLRLGLFVDCCCSENARLAGLQPSGDPISTPHLTVEALGLWTRESVPGFT